MFKYLLSLRAKVLKSITLLKVVLTFKTKLLETKWVFEYLQAELYMIKMSENNEMMKCMYRTDENIRLAINQKNDILPTQIKCDVFISNAYHELFFSVPSDCCHLYSTIFFIWQNEKVFCLQKEIRNVWKWFFFFICEALTCFRV